MPKVLICADRFSAGVEVIDWDDPFWQRVCPEQLSGCWLWTECLSEGYGTFCERQRSHRSHRYSLEQKIGRPLVRGEVAMHICDNRACCNPNHLRVGTNAENFADMRAKKRHMMGERHSMAKLTEADVRSIRSSTDRAVELAERFGVAFGTIYAIKRRELWKHIA